MLRYTPKCPYPIMNRSLLLCIFLCLIGVIQAAPTTNTTNTTTSDSLKTPSFTTRTLWSIISSCVLTLFACIYTAIHPNILSLKDNLLRTLWWRFGLGTMIMALIAPELIVTWAMRQWLSARQVTRQFQESGYFEISHPQAREKSKDNDNGPIIATVEQYVEGGHGGTRALTKLFKKLLKACVSERCEDYTWTHTHSFFVLMGGFMLYVDGEPYLTLQPDEVLKLIRGRRIDIPTLTANQIHDKGKDNAISKGLIILQVAWFILQLITRAIYHLEITQLEVGTLAFAVLNFITYAVWWNKPLNVQYPHPVYWKSTTESRLEDYVPKDFFQSGVSAWVETWRSVSIPIVELLGLRDIPTHRKLRVPTFDGSVKLDGLDISYAGLFMATIFGGIHCMAWFYAFPTYQEQFYSHFTRLL
ncbi:hypothetical protein BDR07DRAFT_1412090 [Suillus spraguei]|nr:hypothetical protein BDR07DRAFT_1412090 [Suillus spraguei]